MIAVIYQAAPPPAKDGILKPMKPGGYSDSGADIAYALRQQGIAVVTPVDAPDVMRGYDWVFPDTQEGITAALAKGASTIWLNTILYKGHPIEPFIKEGIAVVGQTPENTDLYDDKWITNELLKHHQLPIPRAMLITKEHQELSFPFPVVIKPIRGRGSQGVTLVEDAQAFKAVITAMLDGNEYGDTLYAEEFLKGQEITITVMPPGTYHIDDADIYKSHHWSLPPVRRFNHQNGVAPYNGTVAVVHNSEVLGNAELAQPDIRQLCTQCEQAARLVGARAAIRIDCRADGEGKYYLFDLNMKPNMTGAARPHRSDQDSLTALAARRIGWDFNALILNMLQQRWKV
jgi:D-alanine-D-alanine ligase